MTSDRLSVTRFLGLQVEDRGPDTETARRFRERWKALGLVERLFERRVSGSMLQETPQ